MYVVVMIGNSDNKLSQAEWSDFVNDIRHELDRNVNFGAVHGQWHSFPDSQYQNAAFGFQFTSRQKSAKYFESTILPAVKSYFRYLADRYNQDSIAWMQSDRIEMLKPSKLLDPVTGIDSE